MNRESTPEEPRRDAGADHPQRTRRRGRNIAEYVLVAVVMGSLGVMAVPRPEAETLSLEGVAQARQLHDALTEFRSALIEYRKEHANYPGYLEGRPGLRMQGDLSYEAFEAQLLGWSNVWGRASRTWTSLYPLGPYLMYGIPENPVNGLDSVRLLPHQDPFPDQADGETGWLFKPRTGELRANCAGTVVGSQTRYYDL